MPGIDGWSVTVAGWGEGTLVQRVLVGLLGVVLGGTAPAAAGIQLKEGRAGDRPTEDAGVRIENGPGAAGFGIDSPEGRPDGSGTHPGVGGF